MKTGWQIALGVLFGLLGAGVILLTSQPPRGTGITLLPPPTPAPIMVHVSGAVNAPGVYALPPESRVQDAIQLAGGGTGNANLQAVNLAAPIEDGERILVPAVPPTPTPGPVRSSGVQEPAAVATEPTASGLIQINTATQAELERLPGIGPVTAQKIIDYRTNSGPFASIEEIQKVSGIGPVTFEKIQDLITVEALP